MGSTTESSAPASQPATSRAGRPPLRILYADDLRELRDVARISFSRDGHGIECVEDGALALERYKADPKIDLIITDHHMPNMNGLEFVTRLRELDYHGKIMVFSSELSEAVARQYRERHVDRILYKPIFPSALRQNLAELFPVPPESA